MHAIMHHPKKDVLIVGLRSKHPYTPFSEESTQMIHTMGNVECIELCDILPKIRRKVLDAKDLLAFCELRYLSGSYKCNTKIKQREIRRIENPFTSKKSGSRGARHGKLKRNARIYQARLCLRKAHKNGFRTILQRFQGCEIYNNSQLNIGWAEELSEHVDEIAQEDRSYVATWQEGQRQTKCGHERTVLEHYENFMK